MFHQHVDLIHNKVLNTKTEFQHKQSVLFEYLKRKKLNLLKEKFYFILLLKFVVATCC
jgi:hypothetical protein